MLGGEDRFSVVRADARRLGGDGGWARAMLADPPGQLGMGGEDWDAPNPNFVEETADAFREALRVCQRGAPGFVWAPPRTSDFTATALRRAGWIVEDKFYVINASRRAPSSRRLASAVDEWIQVRAPGAPIGPARGRPCMRNAALAHDAGCDDACSAACAVEYLVRHAGRRQSGSRKAGARRGMGYRGRGRGDGGPAILGESGSADRFFPVFRFQPPARGRLRDAFMPPGEENLCPAAKPVELGAFLGSLIASPGDVVLDLFAGWGGLSAGLLLAGFRVVAVERDARAASACEARLRAAAALCGDQIRDP